MLRCCTALVYAIRCKATIDDHTAFDQSTTMAHALLLSIGFEVCQSRLHAFPHPPPQRARCEGRPRSAGGCSGRPGTEYPCRDRQRAKVAQRALQRYAILKLHGGKDLHMVAWQLTDHCRFWGHPPHHTCLLNRVRQYSSFSQTCQQTVTLTQDRPSAGDVRYQRLSSRGGRATACVLHTFPITPDPGDIRTRADRKVGARLERACRSAQRDGSPSAQHRRRPTEASRVQRGVSKILPSSRGGARQQLAFVQRSQCGSPRLDEPLGRTALVGGRLCYGA